MKGKRTGGDGSRMRTEKEMKRKIRKIRTR
jgi:hypothetical protein